MMTTRELHAELGGKKSDKLPVLFIGHGSPMNAIEDNEYVRTWKAIATQLPKPKAILAISAHWLTHGTHVLSVPHHPNPRPDSPRGLIWRIMKRF